MDTQTASSPTLPTAQVIGNAFAEQYYHILHQSPELVHRFYQESSVLSRPEPNGVMTSVTTTEGINDKICSFDYKNYKAEIKTADAQESYKDGVIVLVTGCLTGMDNIRRKFTQTFFLAPQDKGYFVLNDVFRYMEDSEPLESNEIIVNGVHDTLLASVTPDPEPVHVYDPPEVDSTTSLMEEVHIQHFEEKPRDTVDNEKGLVNDEEVVVEYEPQSVENHILAVTESASYTAQEDAPKKSYASILSSQTKKRGSGPAKVYVQANTSRVGPTKTEKFTPAPVAHDPVTEASAPSASGSVNAPQSRSAQEEAEGYSIYVRDLPLDMTASQFEEEFTKFGPIKQGGVQVRSNKDFCFGFVEFLSSSSMNDAIQASSITIGDKQAFVEKKRATTRVGSGRERFASGRVGFRSDSFRGRRNFVGGRGYGRNEVGNRGGDFSGRGRGPGGHSGEGSQQGRGRGGRRGVSNWNPVSA